MNLFATHHGSGSASQKKNVHHGMSEDDIKKVVYNTESFHIIQEQLRVNYQAQSNSVARQVAIYLIREQHLQQQQLQSRREQQLRQEQRQLQIARELTEARIKSQQALKLKIKTKHESDSDNEETDNTRNNHRNDDDDDDFRNDIHSTGKSHNNHSPTSVLSTCASIPDDVIAADDSLLTAPLVSMNDYDSEDGDIQEVED
jgi:multidrug efflux pump subunit AcrA (membrane-fusion protein)